MATLPNRLIASWQPDRKVAQWADRQGFGPATEFSDAALRDLAGAQKAAPAGWYLWESAEHEIYIGISTSSVIPRLRAHARFFAAANPQSFRYRPSSAGRTELRAVEQQMIYDAINQGFPAYNREHSAGILGPSVFDDDVPVARQTAWYCDPVGANAEAPMTSRVPDPSAIPRATMTFTKFDGLAEAVEISEAIALYLRSCVPFPVETEGDYWTVTCLPSWSSARLVTVNMRFVEVLYVNRDPSTGAVSIHVSSDRTLLPSGWGRSRLEKLGVSRGGMRHTAGGPYEDVLDFDSVAGFVAALTTSPEVRRAIARFTLDKMRAGRVSGRYRDAHNALFAQRALDGMAQFTPDRF